MKLIDKVWKRNALYLHSLLEYTGKEIHHVFPRIGVCKCCLLLLVPAKHGHQDDWEWVRSLREINLDTKYKAEVNYVKGEGCKKRIDKRCYLCSMPIIGEEKALQGKEKSI